MFGMLMGAVFGIVGMLVDEELEKTDEFNEKHEPTNHYLASGSFSLVVTIIVSRGKAERQQCGHP